MMSDKAVALRDLEKEARRQRAILVKPPINAIGDKWYRFESMHSQDGYDTPSIIIRELEVVKLTPCGVRLNCGWGMTRFVENVESRSQGRRYAYRDKARAWESFLIRTRRRLGYAEANARYCAALADLTAAVKLEDFADKEEISAASNFIPTRNGLPFKEIK